MIRIITDSCSDLSLDLLKQFDISLVHLGVFIDEKIYRDGIDLSTEELFRLVDQTKKLPKTSAPSVTEFVEEFQRKPGDILCITIGSKISATYQNACIAAQSITDRKVVILDSANLSTGIGLLVCRAAELRDEGKDLEQIKSEIEALIPKVRTAFIIDTLDYLYMGGRCSTMENVVGSLLKIRPVIEVRQDGTLGVREKIRGSRKKSLDALLTSLSSIADSIDPSRIFITHASCDEESVVLAEDLKKSIAVKELHITRAGATVSSHCGPGTVGIIYALK